MRTIFTLLIAFLLLIPMAVLPQANLTIHNGAQLTVNGNLEIIPVWTCGSPVTDIRDGKSYNTVQIGTQCWMGQNLNYGTRINGSSEQTNNSIQEKYCYNDDENYCNIYGGLYQWDEAMQYIPTEGTQGICPTGWHIPSDPEWTVLATILGGESVAGGKMKEAGLVHWYTPNAGATNISGFTALPGGSRYDNGYFFGLTGTTFFWSSSQYDATYAWFRYLAYDLEYVYRNFETKASGYSVRCLKD
jgi:uncharacterized protein (TIGR02145 family)